MKPRTFFIGSIILIIIFMILGILTGLTGEPTKGGEFLVFSLGLGMGYCLREVVRDEE